MRLARPLGRRLASRSARRRRGRSSRVRLCETMSCISRAIRARSAAAPSRPSWSRSTSSRAARSCSEISSSRRWRTVRLRARRRRRQAGQPDPVSSTAPTGDHRTAAIIAPSSTIDGRQGDLGHSLSSATQYRAISTATSASCGAEMQPLRERDRRDSRKAQPRVLAAATATAAQSAAQKATVVGVRRCWIASPTMLSAAVPSAIDELEQRRTASTGEALDALFSQLDASRVRPSASTDEHIGARRCERRDARRVQSNSGASSPCGSGSARGAG